MIVEEVGSVLNEEKSEDGRRNGGSLLNFGGDFGVRAECGHGRLVVPVFEGNGLRTWRGMKVERIVGRLILDLRLWTWEGICGKTLSLISN